MSNTHKALRYFNEAWNQGKLAVIEEIIAPNWFTHDTQTPFPNEKGPKAVTKLLGFYRESFPDVNFVVEDVLEHGDKVITRWTATGTHKAPLMGVPATNKKSVVTGINIDRFENGKIVESWGNWDTLGMLQQLGVVPKMG
jgi:steroid delta-isomerase-like uncharacterized protein